MMYKNIMTITLISGSLFFASCGAPSGETKDKDNTASPEQFNVTAESFADLQVLRYQVPGWDQLSAQQKELAYYLYQASLSGRDIIYDQRGKYSLLVRKTLEAIWETTKADKSGDDWEKFKTYAGQVWFSNGVYHHYSTDKIIPACSFEYFSGLVKQSDAGKLPLDNGETVDAFLTRIRPVIFDPKFEPKMVDLRAGIDNVANSFNNFYEGVPRKK
ncbi:MAG TPA: hypothetical protein PKE30_04290 [Niabella sp.]|nr:hypothetical protein [Niabella sp.]